VLAAAAAIATFYLYHLGGVGVRVSHQVPVTSAATSAALAASTARASIV